MGRSRRAPSFKPKRVKIKLAVGNLELRPVDEKRAIQRAQRDNGKLVVRKARLLALARMKFNRHVPERRHPRSMIDYYQYSVRPDGTLTLFNPTLRGRAFERGAKAHTFGPVRKPLLKWWSVEHGWTQRLRVEHTGQTGRWPMRDAMDGSAPEFAINLSNSIQMELDRASH